MQQGFLNVNGIPTRVVTWGKWVEDDFTEDEGRDIVLCIPGNPGVTEMYIKFLETVYQQVRCPVWIVGHAGHEKPSNVNMPSLTGNEKFFSLQGQINHKAAFIEKYVPNDARIHFIGHSVGSYTIMNLLKIPSIKSRVVKNYFLFPTIERLKESTNGIFMTKIIHPMVPVILFFSWIFSILPTVVQIFLIFCYCKVVNVETFQIRAIIDFVDPYVLRNVFYMAYEQINFVRTRDNEILEANKDNVKLYYGAVDNWVLNECCSSLKKDIPGIDAEVSQYDFAHIFVYRDSEELGKLVATWVKGEL